MWSQMHLKKTPQRKPNKQTIWDIEALKDLHNCLEETLGNQLETRQKT
jgi:hypothetical protein